MAHKKFMKTITAADYVNLGAALKDIFANCVDITVYLQTTAKQAKMEFAPPVLNDVVSTIEGVNKYIDSLDYDALCNTYNGMLSYVNDDAAIEYIRNKYTGTLNLPSYVDDDDEETVDSNEEYDANGEVMFNGDNTSVQESESVDQVIAESTSDPEDKAEEASAEE